MRLTNVRGFHGERAVDLDLKRPDSTHAGWTVVAGRNGSGKTSLLRGIALAISGPAVARTLVPGFENWISVGRQSAEAAVRLVYDRTLDRTGGTAERPPVESFWAGLEWVAPTSVDHPPRRGAQPALREYEAAADAELVPRQGPWQDNPTGWFCAAYGPFRRLVGGSGDAQRLMLTPGPVARLATLFNEDASLAEGVSWLIEEHLRSLEGRPGAEETKNVALDILRDGLLPDGYGVGRVDSDGLWVTKDGNRFPLREMSDGYRTVAALVVDLIKQIHEAYGELMAESTDGKMTINAPGVVIIDEIDAHLHVSWQKRIGEWLKTHFPRVQFIVTTHSPYICQAADPGGLISLPGPDEMRPPRVVDQDLYERVVFGSGDDAVLSDLFGLETPYSERAEALRRELVRLEVAVLAGTAGAAQVERYRELARTLTSSPSARVDEVAARLRPTAEPGA
ncbi:AAA family ATPase [Polymorphospora rubra]|uniref:AAA family ATPase n=1 Tax=Polymorphospora rubra TaxID=338584 RepID=UPI0033F3C82C